MFSTCLAMHVYAVFLHLNPSELPLWEIVSIDAAWTSQCIVGFFYGANISVHWKDFAIDNGLKMADSLISALSMRLRRTQSIFFNSHFVVMV